jgi:hypothetical protein
MCNNYVILMYLGDAGGPGADEADWRVGGLRDHRARLWWGYQEGAFIRIRLYMWYIRICLYMHTHTASPTVVRLSRRCIYTYMFVHVIYTYMFIHAYTYSEPDCGEAMKKGAFIRICVHLYARVCIYSYMCAFIRIWWGYEEGACIRICLNLHMRLYVHVYACIYI